MGYVKLIEHAFMENKRLIRIKGDRIYLTEDLVLEISKTSLAGQNLKFKTVRDIYFEVAVIEFDKERKEITLEVIDYDPDETERFRSQTTKGSVSFIHFKPLKWAQLERHLGSYTKQILVQQKIVEDDGGPILRISASKENGLFKTGNGFDGIQANSKFTSFERTASAQFVKKEPVIETITEESKISFYKADFNNGFVAFSYKSGKFDRKYNLSIANDFLRKEFNAVKAYFPKAFGGQKHFSVTVTFTKTDGLITEVAAESEDIAAINANLIELIKQDRIAKFTTTPLVEAGNKSIYTAEEIFSVFNEEPEIANVLKQSEQEIVNHLIEMNKVRNAKHLQYLSGSKQSTNQKLRFTLKPLFGFLFFIEGETKHHFCWELLKSHATYLWTFEKNEQAIDLQFNRVELTINDIREFGREAYRKRYRNKLVDTELTFCVIEHENINSGSNESFNDWKNKLNERLL